jgi:hypothetical protein
VAERFARLGLVDAYQAARGLEPDELMPEATYYQWRRAERGFHTDHDLSARG